MSQAKSPSPGKPDDGEESTSTRALILVFVGLLLSRVAVSVALPSLPDMEPAYAEMAEVLWLTDQPTDIYLSPGYGLALLATRALSGSWVVASHTLFVLFSSLQAVALYMLAAKTIGLRGAFYVLLLAIPMPLLTVAVAGYSHSVVVGSGLLALFMVFARDPLGSPVWAAGVVAGLCASFAASVRPEFHLHIVAVFLVALSQAVCGEPQARRRLMTSLAIALTTYSGATAGEYSWRALRSTSEQVGVFGDARYSYQTYMHTLSLREAGYIDDDLALQLSDRAFGPAAGNGYSILRAVVVNPLEATRNVLFNAKELLTHLGHPLFFPVFMYPLIGIGLIGWPTGLGRFNLLLGAVVTPTLLQVLLFHVEVRYMLPLSIPFLLLCGAALAKLTSAGRRYTAGAVIAALLAISTVYVFALRSGRGLG